MDYLVICCGKCPNSGSLRDIYSFIFRIKWHMMVTERRREIKINARNNEDKKWLS